eukprot:IDg7370t1
MDIATRCTVHRAENTSVLILHALLHVHEKSGLISLSPSPIAMLSTRRHRCLQALRIDNSVKSIYRSKHLGRRISRSHPLASRPLADQRARTRCHSFDEDGKVYGSSVSSVRYGNRIQRLAIWMCGVYRYFYLGRNAQAK